MLEVTLRIDVEEGAARWSEIVAEVEAGRDVVIARGAVPVAIVRAHRPRPDLDEVDAAIAALRESRKGYPPITIDEIVEWKNEDRR